ncbi:uncharacterized protein MELLADRAFT_123534 [Melampsora larici-populina 98AG31]|uniref:Secreted protein n=1 Tax=Melampsora larici-populina (strain 98AG31 / pathotype 3-4-7) TaxID=747676 RepID=F4S7J2_MELLP|nr:uncharacterized protein MELLADRAFT_123533 [Melampsora larici-populina 98AG31]XP_007418865.1 uncharacterized protein MELLADRAFT_123534 [Melampsora larici-populina 98AG31]EGF97871.1 secreted protein [Melampsora larici-populina 98AG31]EGF99384.1 secreted protein [Melampsora larici-populina 98AG31]
MHIRASGKLDLFLVTCVFFINFSSNVLALPYPHKSQLGTYSATSESSTQLQKRAVIATAYLTSDFVKQTLARNREINTSQEREDLRTDREINKSGEKENNQRDTKVLEDDLRTECVRGIDPTTGRCL